MLETIPSKLYKYQSCNEYAIANLRQGCLWFSKPEAFNDPFDCDINFTITDITEENISSLFNTYLVQAPDKKAFLAKYGVNGSFNDRFRNDIVNFATITTELIKKKLWSQIGVACFAEDNDHILMWSHYANAHQGFCLEFDTSFAPFSEAGADHSLKVHYSRLNKYPSLSLVDIQHESLPSLSRALLGTKSMHWSYEKEWRMFSSNGNKEYSYNKSALTGIYFGCKMKDDDKAKIASILANSSTRFYQMQRSRSEFSLSEKEI